MTTHVLEFQDDVRPPAGDPTRFERRWHLVGAGLSNIWFYGDLRLPAATGRLLLRGPNGTGKTTALEALCPYLLDLNQQRLGAGKSRTTTLKSLMATGAVGKRRYGYLWLEFAAPADGGVLSFGARLLYSQSGSPAVVVVPFMIPGRPLVDLPLHGPNRAPLTAEEFTAAVDAIGGEIFDDPEDYITRLATHVLKMEPDDVRLLAQRMRQVRNPSLLGDVTAREAADSLRESLPGVDPDIVTATANALSESESTRDAFRRDAEAADVLADFAAVWTGHVVTVVGELHRTAAARAGEARTAAAALKRARGGLEGAVARSEAADEAVERVNEELAAARARVRAAEQHDAYKAAGRITDLGETVEALADNASLETGRLSAVATALAESGRRLAGHAEVMTTDISGLVQAAAEADPASAPEEPPFTWRTVPRAVITVGGTTADPGPAVRVDAATDELDTLAAGWTELGSQHRTRAESAGLAMKDHEAVADAETAAVQAERDHAAKADEADRAAGRERSATTAARDAATALAGRITTYSADNPDLSADWRDVIGDLAALEPAAALEAATGWIEIVRHRGADSAGRLDAQAAEIAGRATAARTEAGELRRRAAELRAGRLLPLPRPSWAGPGEDDTALGSALDWRADVADPGDRALLESAMAAAGLLGATLHHDSAGTAVWTVTAQDTRPVGDSLNRVLTVDPRHPRAATAEAVLARIGYEPSALAVGDTGVLTIGADGTFRAGVLRGRAPGATADSDAPAASHIGARQRRAAALVEADRLEVEADGLVATAEGLDAAAARSAAEATDLRRRAGAFPKLGPLTAAEAERSRLAGNALDAVAAADTADRLARVLRAEHRAVAVEWSDRTRARGLPADITALTTLRQDGARIAAALDRAARDLSTRLIGRVRTLLNDVRADDDKAAGLVTLTATARAAHERATEAEATLDHLRRSIGSSAAQAVQEHRDATAAELEANARVKEATAQAQNLAKAVGTATTAHDLAAAHEARTRPAASQAALLLRQLVMVDGVASCLGIDQADVPDADLPDLVSHALTGRRTNVRKTVRERYDLARATLAGTWALEPGDSHGELDTYVLTHQDHTYTPHAAAAHARTLKERAETALAVAEEAALRDFVVGRLPSAIGVAWQRLEDWSKTVNRKMRTAAASSGVGVQVRVQLLKDLSKAVATVHELSCRTSDAARGPQEKQRVGQALQALIAAAPGDTMDAKVAAAVDIREWVSVHYEVDRPGHPPTRWGPRTGLSGGERRLVVLAPMLAAIAAAYDRTESDGLRLATLDEVPAEVDEKGRTALARYLAELDLDLLCTSYLWDGAPGAWDGIDAHDLEKDMDGTVVAFPMLVRGLIENLDEL